MNHVFGVDVRKFVAGIAAWGLASATIGCAAPDVSEPPPALSTVDSYLSVGMPFVPQSQWSVYSTDAWILQRLGVTEPLIQFSASGVPLPGLAEGFEVINETTVQFSLRPEATFHDGSPVTAEAVAASLQFLVQAPEKPAVLAEVELTVEVTDDNQVRVTSATPDPILVQRFGDPQTAILHASAFEDDPAAPSALGAATGPFRLTDITDDGKAVAEAFDNYWEGTPHIPGVVASFLGAADDRVDAFETHAQDVVYGLPASLVADADPDRLLQWELPRTTMVSLNTSRGVFKDQSLRMAAREALTDPDFQAMLAGDVADPASRLFRDTAPWVEHEPRPNYPPASNPTGKHLTIATYNDRPELPVMIDALVNQLKMKGFGVTVAPIRPYNDMREELLSGKYDMVLNSQNYMSKAVDPVAILAHDFTCTAPHNLSQYCSAGLDDDIAEAMAIADIDRRRSQAVAIESTLLERGVFIPLVHDRARLGRRKPITKLMEDPMEWNLITHHTTDDS